MQYIVCVFSCVYSHCTSGSSFSQTCMSCCRCCQTAGQVTCPRPGTGNSRNLWAGSDPATCQNICLLMSMMKQGEITVRTTSSNARLVSLEYLIKRNRHWTTAVSVTKAPLLLLRTDIYALWRNNLGLSFTLFIVIKRVCIMIVPVTTSCLWDV